VIDGAQPTAAPIVLCPGNRIARRGILLAGIACVISSAALADSPVAGQLFVASSAIVCDTKEQVAELYSATKSDGVKGILEKYREYNGVRDKAGEPICNMQPILGSPIKSVEDLGTSNGFSDYTTVHGWLVEITGTDSSSV